MLMRQKLPEGMSLTFGTYADEGALLDRKREAMAQVIVWVNTNSAPEQRSSSAG
jgi:hypothetical protein